ncbi:hypothetical protein E2C01_043041 [Portunus trituberculatus]|uniref:Uncharacterized protein n=1 Tax=Portunus trituberculatus TaxID=210409 RepID=A0A5B7FY57_PORTR|nr:hypothetical protein [Portunus trituberculatus]
MATTPTSEFPFGEGNPNNESDSVEGRLAVQDRITSQTKKASGCLAEPESIPEAVLGTRLASCGVSA